MSLSATEASDCSLIIKSFQKHLLSTPTEESILAASLSRLVSIHSNSVSSAEALRNLTSPPIPDEILKSFDKKASTSETSATLPELQEEVEKSVDISRFQDFLDACIPCDFRVDLRAEFSSSLDEDLLQTLTQMGDGYLKQLAFVVNLLNSKDVYADVCPMLFAFQDICIPDLQRMISLLSGILYRISVKELAGVDLIKLLVLPIFQPIFSGLVGLLLHYKLLIVNPLECVNANLSFQLEKIKTSQILNPEVVDTIVTSSENLKITSPKSRDDMIRALNTARIPFSTLDQGINAIQNTAGSAAFNINRLLTVGTSEVNMLIETLKTELASFIGTSENESVEFLLTQYQKLTIFRSIVFLASLVQAKGSGFSCDFKNEDTAQGTVDQFLNEFLGPNSPILVTKNSITGDTELFFNPDLSQIGKTTRVIELSTKIASTGNAVVDKSIDAIITQSSQPVAIKPECVFVKGSTDANKLAQFINELNGA